MELAYFKVKQYKNFENLESLFRRDLSISFKGTDEFKVEISKVETNVKDFWGPGISNLSMIVGENGAGKTTIVNCIKDFFSGDLGYRDYIFIFLNEKNDEYEFTICASEKIYFQLKEDKDYCSKENISIVRWDPNTKTTNQCKINKNYNRQLVSEKKIIYFTNYFSADDYTSPLYPDNIEDLSTGGLMRRDYRRGFQNKHINLNYNQNINFFYSETYRQINLINSMSELKGDIKLEIPEFIHIGLKRSSNIENYKDIIDDTVYKKIKTIKNKKLQKASFTDRISIEILTSCILEICMINLVPHKKEKENRLAVDCLSDVKEENIYEYCKKSLENFEKSLNSQESIYSESLGPYKEFVIWLNENRVSIDNGYFEERERCILSIKNSKDIFEELFKLYRKTSISYQYLNFEWKMSTGEYNMFSLYSRIHSIFKKTGDRNKGMVTNNFPNKEVLCKSILLIIDEAELSYHPEWQRNYIDYLLDFISKVFKGLKVQVILTTHSPIMLSDVPKRNVIFLRKGKDYSEFSGETFGQNIHTLFKKGFFLESSTGKFSENKIKNISEKINNYEKNSSIYGEEDVSILGEIEELISYVGEPLVKEALRRKLEKAQKNLKSRIHSKKLESMINSYESLNFEERKELIEYILEKESY